MLVRKVLTANSGEMTGRDGEWHATQVPDRTPTGDVVGHGWRPEPMPPGRHVFASSDRHTVSLNDSKVTQLLYVPMELFHHSIIDNILNFRLNCCSVVSIWIKRDDEMCFLFSMSPLPGVPELWLVGRREEWEHRNRPQRVPDGALRSINTHHVSCSDLTTAVNKFLTLNI